MPEKIEVYNIIQPGKTYRVDKAKYEAARDAYLAVVPDAAPGMTVSEIGKAIVNHLPDELFPAGAKAGWWMKAVQLDLEARGMVRRQKTTPLRFHKA